MKKLRRLFKNRELWFVGASSFALGAGLALVYVLGHPIQIKAETKYICTFKTPDGWMWPESN